MHTCNWKVVFGFRSTEPEPVPVWASTPAKALTEAVRTLSAEQKRTLVSVICVGVAPYRGQRENVDDDTYRFCGPCADAFVLGPGATISYLLGLLWPTGNPEEQWDSDTIEHVAEALLPYARARKHATTEAEREGYERGGGR